MIRDDSQGRYELYVITYDKHRQPSYTPVGTPMATLEQAQRAAGELEAEGKLWEIIEIMRRLVDFSDRVPERVANKVFRIPMRD